MPSLTSPLSPSSANRTIWRRGAAFAPAKGDVGNCICDSRISTGGPAGRDANGLRKEVIKNRKRKNLVILLADIGQGRERVAYTPSYRGRGRSWARHFYGELQQALFVRWAGLLSAHLISSAPLPRCNPGSSWRGGRRLDSSFPCAFPPHKAAS